MAFAVDSPRLNEDEVLRALATLAGDVDPAQARWVAEELAAARRDPFPPLPEGLFRWVRTGPYLALGAYSEGTLLLFLQRHPTENELRGLCARVASWRGRAPVNARMIHRHHYDHTMPIMP